MTKTEFIREYCAFLVASYPWARDSGRLESFMESVARTLDAKPGTQWHWDSNGTKAAWQAIGGKGKPTLKALRALT